MYRTNESIGIAEKNDHFIPRLFLHFLDIYHYRLAKDIFKYPDTLIFSELRLGFRLAFLLSKEIFISASAYFENPITRKILKEHLEICEAGFVFITSNDPTLFEQFERKKKFHFDENSPAELRSAYKKMPIIPVLYKAGNIKTSRIITKQWYEILNSGNLLSFLDPNESIKFPKNFEQVWQKIPEVLEKRAFVTPHVIQSFNKLGVISPSELNLHKVIDSGYTISHTDPLQCGLVDDLLYTQPPWSIKNSYLGFSYKIVKENLIRYDLLTLIKNSDSNSLLRLRLSPIWNALIPLLVSRIGEDDDQIRKSLNEVKRFLLSSEVKLIKPLMKNVIKQIGIVTALPEEWLAVITCLDAQEVDGIENDPNRYALATLNVSESLEDKALEIVITFLPRMGTNSAATVTTNLLRSFPNIDDLIFSGIACGCPFPSDIGKHVRLGDVVVSDLKGLVQLDYQVVKGNKLENRSNMPLPSRALLNSIRLLQADELNGSCIWNTILDGLIKKNKIFKRPPALTDVLTDENGLIVNHPKDSKRDNRYPKVFHGAIGSSNSLMRNRKLRNKLSVKYDLRAIEMEGAGTAEAVWQFGKNYLVVRGICDYGDDLKNDRWHYYAAASAAAYTRAILIRLIKQS